MGAVVSDPALDALAALGTARGSGWSREPWLSILDEAFTHLEKHGLNTTVPLLHAFVVSRAEERSLPAPLTASSLAKYLLDSQWRERWLNVKSR